MGGSRKPVPSRMYEHHQYMVSHTYRGQTGHTIMKVGDSGGVLRGTSLVLSN